MGAQKTLLVTRPAPDNIETARLLQKAGFRVELLPLLEFKALDFEPPAPEKLVAIAVTSANALRALERFQDKWLRLSGSQTRPNNNLEPGFVKPKTEKAPKQKNMLEDLQKLPLFAVGQKTATMAKTLGFADVRTANGNLLSLVELIKANRLKGALFYPAARQLSGDLGSMLGGNEITVKTVVVYEMVVQKKLNHLQKNMLSGNSIDAALFYSRRSAETFLSLCGLYALNTHSLPVLCLSQNVANIFEHAGFEQIHLSGAPNQQAMIALALSFAPINSK